VENFADKEHFVWHIYILYISVNLRVNFMDSIKPQKFFPLEKITHYAVIHITTSVFPFFALYYQKNHLMGLSSSAE